MRKLVWFLVLLLLLGTGCFVSEKGPRSYQARPRRAVLRPFKVVQGTTEEMTAKTCTAWLVWPAENLEGYLEDLEREVGEYRRSPWRGE